MTEHSHVLARALALVLVVGALGAGAASAAAPTHLTTAAWQALSTVNAMSNSTVAACQHVGAGSTDEQVRGIVGICTDGAETGDWLTRILLQCGSSASERQCGDDIAGVDSDLSAIAAWAHWFTTQLDTGGCRSFFSYLAQADGAEARAGGPLAADLRAGDPSVKLRSAWHDWANQLRADNQELDSHTGTLYVDLGACKPSP